MTHPARYSAVLLDALRPILAAAPHVHDPFAGTGERLGALCDELGVSFTGTEIEPEFAEDRRVMVGDSRDAGTYPRLPHWIVTSPVYPNGMADNFRPSGVCSACGGHGHLGPENGLPGSWPLTRCVKCGGTGRRPIDRKTYRVAKIEATGDEYAELAEGNMGRHSYRSGRKAAARYWELAEAVVARWGDAERAIVNVSDFYMAGDRVPLVQTWCELLAAHGWAIYRTFDVVTPRMRNGANRGKRVEGEAIIVTECRT